MKIVPYHAARRVQIQTNNNLNLTEAYVVRTNKQKLRDWYSDLIWNKQKKNGGRYRMISSWTLTLRVLFGSTMLLTTTTSSSTSTASPRIVIPSLAL